MSSDNILDLGTRWLACNFCLGGENFSAIIVGSGFSGIDVANKLKEAGIKFVILEKVCLINREFPNLTQFSFTEFGTWRYLARKYLSRCGLWCYVSSLQVVISMKQSQQHLHAFPIPYHVTYLSSIFSLSSLPNPLWNRAYSAGGEILKYLQDVAQQFGVYQNIRFNTRVTEAMWLEDHQKWEIITQEGERLRANFLIDGGGRFHVPLIPQLKGQGCY